MTPLVADTPATLTPLADVADRWLDALAAATRSPAIAALDGSTLLGERAMQRGLRIPGRVSAGGGCRFYPARDGAIALNLARVDDRSFLPALFRADAFDTDDTAAIGARIAEADAQTLVDRGRELGLAIAAIDERGTSIVACEIVAHGPLRTAWRAAPRVLDLTAIWAGPLAGHLLALAGADVVRIESPKRPDQMRHGDPALFALLDRGKAALSIDVTDPRQHARLSALIARADIVLESSRPRALAQLGIDANALVATLPGLVWVTITGHGASGEAANWIGFGDDCAVAAGLSRALREITGRIGFVGDAIGDPLTGIRAALETWQAWQRGAAARIGISMRAVVAEALALSDGLPQSLTRWAAAEGEPFPTVDRRAALPPRPLPDWARC